MSPSPEQFSEKNPKIEAALAGLAETGRAEGSLISKLEAIQEQLAVLEKDPDTHTEGVIEPMRGLIVSYKQEIASVYGLSSNEVEEVLRLRKI